jgi:hypothetical protein
VTPPTNNIAGAVATIEEAEEVTVVALPEEPVDAIDYSLLSS